MKINIWVLTILLNSLPKAELQAPGDTDSSCTNPHTTPRNYQVLLDSFMYASLLQGRSPPWQEVDVDGVTDFSKSLTKWTQDGDHMCRQSIWSCHFYLPTQNNWLITQHVSRLVNGILLQQVMAQIEFQVLEFCSGNGDGCQKSFILEVWETSSMDRIQAGNTSLYRRVRRVTPNQESVHASQNISIPINFQTNATGFYLALIDNNTCIAVTRVIVFYYTCPAAVRDSRSYPETPSPPIADHPVPMATSGCVNGESSHKQGRSVSLTCVERGVWREVCITEHDDRNWSPTTIENFVLSSQSVVIRASKTTNNPVITEGQNVASVSSIFPLLEESTSLQSGAVRTMETELVIYIVLSAAIGILLVALVILLVFCIIRRIRPRKIVQQNVNFDEEENIYQEISNYQIRAPSPYIQQDDNPSYGVPLAVIKKCEEAYSPKKGSSEYLEVF